MKLNGREYYVDETGRVCIEDEEWFSAGKFYHGYALVLSREVDYHVMFIDRQGNHAFDRVFPRAGSFRNGVAPVQIDQLWGAINLRGELCCEAKYEELDTTLSDLLRAKLNGKYGYISQSGEWVLDPVYHYAGEVCGELCKVRVSDDWKRA